jgi:small-conductance mechanosensitive channel
MKPALDMLDNVLFGNSLTTWLLAVGVVSLVVSIVLFARGIVRRNYARMAQTEQVEFAEVPLQVVSRTSTLFVILVGLFAGLQIFEMPERVDNIAKTIVVVAVFWQIGIWISTAAIAWIELKRRRSLTTDRAAVGSLTIISVVVRTVIWAVVLLLTLDNLGVNITTLVAGLGIGGIAVALAVQNVLGDLLASLSITLDKPFVVGDFLIVDDFMGSVEYIGIKSTRLRSLSGEQIVMANADLLGSRVRNYGRMHERRVVFNIGITYETPREQVEAIPQLIRDIVTSQEKVRFDRCHFAKFGAASLDYEAVYYVLSADFNQYMDIQQRINLEILKTFEERKIEFAYPTQKLWLARVIAEAKAPAATETTPTSR